ncbi:sickle tail protein homolog [Thalassophryne amazonica]|uniref:sickle tail protein homolog n=1 Tax=Thalassophryne amazonica TaxID=390379 RepID=UPI00147254A8|nr:sickle tail protein homolog [Thalassophryne amazonica]
MSQLHMAGLLYLQYGDETKQVWIPAKVRHWDCLLALFVSAFPQKLSMKMPQSPNMAIFIRNPGCNIYWHLDDIRSVTPHSCLKVSHKDSAVLFSRQSRTANTDQWLHKEILDRPTNPVQTCSPSGCITMHNIQDSMSPPKVCSMPSSPSRIICSGSHTRRASEVLDSGNVTLPREGRSRSLRSRSSAILERIDVKPDDHFGTTMVVRGDRRHYPNSYCSSTQDGVKGQPSIALSQCSAPPSFTADLLNVGVPRILGGLQQFRASIKPLVASEERQDHESHSLHSDRMTAMEEQIASLAGLVHRTLSAGKDATGSKDNLRLMTHDTRKRLKMKLN